MFQGIADWYRQPYSDNMNMTRWFLFIGLTVLFLIIWRIIIGHLMEA